MAARYYEGKTPRKNGDKTYWTRVATMFPAKDGSDKFVAEFEALPLPDADGKVRVMFMPPLPRDDDRPARDAPPARERREPPPAGRRSADDDEIPF
jgi:hypothetical protein